MRILDGSSGIITSYKDEYAVGQDNVIGLNNPGNPDGVADALTDLLRSGARQMLAAAVEVEIQEFVKRHQGLQDEQGCARIVRNGGVHFGVRMDDASQCILVIIGATADGKKELVALHDGYLESEASWKKILQNLKEQGLQHEPELAIGDGALGFWKALPQVFGHTRMQRCWVHKTANILNKLPNNMQPKAKSVIHEIWMAQSRKDAENAFNRFDAQFGAKYPKAAENLVKDRGALLAFYDFPAEHWVHIRTNNPIESTFATVRLRTAKTRGCVSRESILAMVFMLVKSAERGWRKLKGAERLAEVISGVQFKDGMREDIEKISA